MAIYTKLMKHQLKVVDFMLDNENSYTGIFADYGTGKGVLYGTPVLTNASWVNVEDLKIGDLVVSSDGESYPVTGIYPQGIKKTYRIFLNDKTEFVVDEDHLHIIRNRHDKTINRWRVLSTKELLNKKIRSGVKNSPQYEIPVVNPIIFENECKSILHPYLLGVLLGDGYLEDKGSGRIKLYVQSDDVLFKIKKLIPKSIKIVTNKFIYRGKKQWHTSLLPKVQRLNNVLVEELRRLGLMGSRSHNKFIPKEFLFNKDPKDRLELLRGLMDTDGSIENEGACRCNYSTTSKQLAEDVQFLLRSLGELPRWMKSDGYYQGKRTRDCYHIRFISTGFNPFYRLERKLRWVSGKKNKGRRIDRIEYEGEQRTICISIDSPDHSYIIKDFVVTHNTLMMLAFLNIVRFPKVLVISSKTAVLSTWVDEIRQHCDFSYTFLLGSRRQRLINLSMGLRRVYRQPKRKPFLFLINFDGVHSIFLELVKTKFDMIIVDECFLAGTKIKTFLGEKNIEDIQVGDLIYNASGLSKVRCISKREYYGDLFKITLSTGRSFVCTSNHPIFTNKGWVAAKNLISGLEVYDEVCIRRMREGSYRSANLFEEQVLWKELFSEMEDDSAGYQEEDIYRRSQKEDKYIAHGKKTELSCLEQRHTDEGRESSEVVCLFESDEPQTSYSGREWERNVIASEHVVEEIREEMGSRICDMYGCRQGEKVCASSLQGGSCTCKIYDGCRDRWLQSQEFKSAESRSKEGREVDAVRVERVEVYKRGSIERSKFCGEVDKAVNVYNLEVENHPSFFAEGILVHNSTRIKSIKTARTKAIVKLGGYTKHRAILTGFPVTENLADIYSQVKFLDQGKTFGQSFHAFLDDYFVKTGYDRAPQAKGAVKMIRLLQEFCIRITNKDLKLPPAVKKIVNLDATSQQSKMLKSLYDLMRVEFGKVKIDTVYIFTLISKALQICSGFLKESDEYDEDKKLIRKGTMIETFHTPKDEALFDILEDIDIDKNKVIIWCVFRHSVRKLYRLMKGVGYPPLLLTGATEDVNSVVRKFQHDKKYRVMIAIQKKASESITLTASNYAIYYENTWSNDLRSNSEARIRRKGSEIHKSIFYTDLVIKNSIEEDIVKSLHDKGVLVNDLKDKFLKKYK